MMKRTCKQCGHESDCKVDGKYCSISCKKLHIRKYYRERNRMQRELYKKYL
jgi:hypothetical protein